MKHVYRTSGTCATEIIFETDGDIVKNVEFIGGCNGNLKAISILVEGQKIDWIIEKLKGIKCGHKNTSCSDQFANALLKLKENRV